MIDDLHARRPADSTAAKVTSRGTHYVPSNDHLNPDFDVRPGTRPVPAGMKDLTGKVRGRLTVVGFHGKARWVCRCVCGMFCLRRSKAINNPENEQDRCFQCRKLADAKREYHYQKTGRHLDIRDL